VNWHTALLNIYMVLTDKQRGVLRGMVIGMAISISIGIFGPGTIHFLTNESAGTFE